MPKLTDDPKVQELVAKAEAKGAATERKRISSILTDASATAGDLEDAKHKKAVKAALKDVKDRVRQEA